MEGTTINPKFDAVAKNSFGSESQALDFSKSRASAFVINDWVEAQTNHKINDLISPSDLDNNTRVVLVNAIYFMGNWEIPFQPSDTRKDTFYNNGRYATTVDMMSMKTEVKHKDIPALNATAIDLSYKDSDISMLFILPNDYTGLQSLEQSLKRTTFADIVANMEEVKVSVRLPKFKIETEIELKNTLKAVST